MSESLLQVMLDRAFKPQAADSTEHSAQPSGDSLTEDNFTAKRWELKRHTL